MHYNKVCHCRVYDFHLARKTTARVHGQVASLERLRRIPGPGTLSGEYWMVLSPLQPVYLSDLVLMQVKLLQAWQEQIFHLLQALHHKGI